MKYYLYISDAKVDMLLPQIPHEIKQKVALEFKTDIKLFSASRRTETESENDRIARLETVNDYVRSYGRVGSVDLPDDYIADTLPMRWGPYQCMGDNSIVYFGGDTAATSFGLGGSMRHLIGQVGSDSPTPGSYSPFIVRALYEELALKEPAIPGSAGHPPEVYRDPFQAVASANESMCGPTQRLEFLAKRLLDTETDLSLTQRFARVLPEKRIVLATPLYVAIADSL